MPVNCSGNDNDCFTGLLYAVGKPSTDTRGILYKRKTVIADKFSGGLTRDLNIVITEATERNRKYIAYRSGPLPTCQSKLIYSGVYIFVENVLSFRKTA